MFCHRKGESRVGGGNSGFFLLSIAGCVSCSTAGDVSPPSYPHQRPFKEDSDDIHPEIDREII